MSVLVRGMEMPSSCNDCLFGHWSNLYQAVFCELLNFKDYPVDYIGYKAQRLDKCPLVEVPTPHGRLIDADRLKSDNPRHMDADVPYVTEVTVEEIIDDAPTVIEAEVEHED